MLAKKYTHLDAGTIHTHMDAGTINARMDAGTIYTHMDAGKCHHRRSTEGGPARAVGCNAAFY
jgi:hypothetical protein